MFPNFKHVCESRNVFFLKYNIGYVIHGLVSLVIFYYTHNLTPIMSSNVYFKNTFFQESNGNNSTEIELYNIVL